MTPPVTRVLAPNPGPMTLDGTNTWIVADAGEAVVVDPGPLIEAHLTEVLAASAAYRVTAVLLTHGHLDHSEGAAWFAERAGAPVRAIDEHLGDPFRADETVTVGGLRLEVLATPGHTADSACFLLPDHGILFSGDTVLGRGTSVVAHPDGSLGAYLASLERLRELDLKEILPGHGPTVENPRAVLTYYLEHRAERLEQVRAALGAGATTPEEVVRVVYADVDPILWPAAERSVRAQLDYLAGRK